MINVAVARHKKSKALKNVSKEITEIGFKMTVRKRRMSTAIVATMSSSVTSQANYSAEEKSNRFAFPPSSYHDETDLRTLIEHAETKSVQTE